MEKSEIQRIISNVNSLYEEIRDRTLDHFEFLGISKTATQKDIEEKYQNFLRDFPPGSEDYITNPEIKEKFMFILNRARKAYNVIADYQKRGEYEKNGFREKSEIPQEEDPIEKARLLYRKGKALYQRQQHQMAIALLEQSVAIDPKSDSLLLLGMVQTGFPELRRKAEVNLQKASEMESWNAEPYAALGLLFYHERLYKRAEGYFRRALELDPAHALARNRLEEIAGPDKRDILGEVQNQLKKVLPTFFGKKKK
jgi:tetratricopeptide (TPR) repeat protein